MQESGDPAVEGAWEAADLAVLEEAFAGLESLVPGLPARLVRYVVEGEEASAPGALAKLNGKACEALRVKSRADQLHSVPDEGPAWRRWFEGAEGPGAAALLRLAKVITAPAPTLPPWAVAAGTKVDRSALLRPLDPPDWLEPLLWEFSSPKQTSRSPFWLANTLSAARVEGLLRADGVPANLLYRDAFPSQRFGFSTLRLLAGLVGYGEGVARHPVIVLEALARPSASEKARALDMFPAHEIPAAPFVEPLTALAVSSAKTVRDAAAALVIGVGELALPHLRPFAESSSPDERLQAVRLLGRLGTDAALALLQDRVTSETSGKVKAALAERLAEAKGDALGPATPPLPPIDVFQGVALGVADREALEALIAEANRKLAAGKTTKYLGQSLKPIGPNTMTEGLERLVQPTPWKGAPGISWATARQTDPSAFEAYLKRPGLTLLHAVRLLRLTGDLCYSHMEGHLGYMDFESPLVAYRDSHEPRFDLRSLAAAFRATGLDELSIARARFNTRGMQRFLWSNEATWPYFAEHLDWLEAAYTATPDRGMDYGLYSQLERRQEVLGILATFPTPPPSFLDLLWGVALGTAKGLRPSAQRALESLPDCGVKVLAALTSGKQDERIAAADWAARLRPEGVSEAVERALAAERKDAVRAALMDARDRLGGGPTPAIASPTEALADDRKALRAEAAKGLKGGIPKELTWFPFGRLPEVRWRLDDAPLAADELAWLVVQAFKAKSPEPNAILRQRVAQWRADDAGRLGRAILDAWIGYDLTGPSDEVVKQRVVEWDKMIAMIMPGVASSQSLEDLRAGQQRFLHQPVGSAIGGKGVLAIAAASGPSSAGATVRGYLDEWYGNRVHQCRALLQMLAWVEDPEAVAVLLAVAKRFRTRSIRQEAEAQVRKLASRKGKTVAELADQALPDLGLDAEGRLVLDFGGRRFIAKLDDGANLVLEDEAGKRIDSLPAPRKADDPAKVAEAKTALAEARTRLKALRKSIADRLYEALCEQRSWRFDDWRSTLLGHPVAGRLCRTLVWSCDSPPATFRPLEDGSLTGPDDDEVRPGPDGTVRLAHTLTLPDERVRQWREHLADYEVEPPFGQFGAAFRLPEAQRGGTSLSATLAQPLNPQILARQAKGLGFDAQAFRFEDGGDEFLKHFPGAGLQAKITVEEAAGEHDGDVYALALSFLRSVDPEGRRADPGHLPLGDVPAVLLSECHANLVALAGRGISSPAPLQE